MSFSSDSEESSTSDTNVNAFTHTFSGIEALSLPGDSEESSTSDIKVTAFAHTFSGVEASSMENQKKALVILER